MKKLFIIISVLIMAACSPEQRLSRLVRNHPELKMIDTVSIRDTVVLPGITIDSIFQLYINDTVFIDKDLVKVKVMRLPGDTVRVYVNQDPKEIVITKQVQVPKYIVQKPTWYTWIENHRTLLIIIGCIIGVLLIVRFVVKLFK